jgi:hypothetical protein
VIKMKLARKGIEDRLDAPLKLPEKHLREQN